MIRLAVSFFFIFLLLALGACKAGDDADDSVATQTEIDETDPVDGGNTEQSEDVEFTGTVTTDDSSIVALPTTISGSNLFQLTYNLNCRTVGPDPEFFSTRITETGKFNLTVPSLKNLSCDISGSDDSVPGNFLFDSALLNSRNAKARASQFYIQNGTGGYKLGELALKVAEGSITVPEQSNTLTSAKPKFPASAMHDVEFVLTCQDKDAATRKSCLWHLNGLGWKDYVGDKAYFYTRVIQAEKGGKDVSLLSVWRDKTQFKNCGSFDMNQAQATAFEERGWRLKDALIGEFTKGRPCLTKSFGQAIERLNDDGLAEYVDGQGQKLGYQHRLEGYLPPEVLVPIGRGYSFLNGFTRISQLVDLSQEQLKTLKDIDPTAMKKLGICFRHSRNSIDILGDTVESVDVVVTIKEISSNCKQTNGTAAYLEETKVFTITLAPYRSTISQ